MRVAFDIKNRKTREELENKCDKNRIFVQREKRNKCVNPTPFFFDFLTKLGSAEGEWGRKKRDRLGVPCDGMAVGMGKGRVVRKRQWR